MAYSYNSTNINGRYEWGGQKPANIHNATLDISNASDTLIIVELKCAKPKVLKENLSLNKISLEEFKGIYAKNRWLRRRLSKNGVESFDDLMN